MKVVVTGKTGVGKSTILKSLGFANILFLDDFVKEKFYIAGHEVFEKVVRTFGHEIVENNKINTKILGSMVLHDKQKLSLLSDFVEPFIIKHLQALEGDWLIEMAPYINHESKYKHFFDNVVLVKRDKHLIVNKFPHIKKAVSTIEDKTIDHDYEILNNSDIDKSKKQLESFLKSIKFKML